MTNNLYFFINGSASPLWIEERKREDGSSYYWEMFSTANFSLKWKEKYNAILTLFRTHQNPINQSFPSFWTKDMCELYNRYVQELFDLTQAEIPLYNIINKNEPIEEDKRRRIYSYNILKHHLGRDRIIHSKQELQEFLESNKETESVLTCTFPYYEPIPITQKEFKAFDRIALDFDDFKQLQISICPFSNKTFLTDINTAGHGAVFYAVRIDRIDLFNRPGKILETLRFK